MCATIRPTTSMSSPISPPCGSRRLAVAGDRHPVHPGRPGHRGEGDGAARTHLPQRHRHPCGRPCCRRRRGALRGRQSGRRARGRHVRELQVTTADSVTALAVPLDAVIREGNVATVWVLREPFVFERRVVRIAVGRASADPQRPLAPARPRWRAAPLPRELPVGGNDGPPNHRVIARRPKADEAISATRTCASEVRLLRFARNDAVPNSRELRHPQPAAPPVAAMLRQIVAWSWRDGRSCCSRSRCSSRSASPRSRPSTSRPIPIRRRRSSKSSPIRPAGVAEEVERYVTIPLEIGARQHAGAQIHPLRHRLRARLDPAAVRVRPRLPSVRRQTLRSATPARHSTGVISVISPAGGIGLSAWWARPTWT